MKRRTRYWLTGFVLLASLLFFSIYVTSKKSPDFKRIIIESKLTFSTKPERAPEWIFRTTGFLDSDLTVLVKFRLSPSDFSKIMAQCESLGYRKGLPKGEQLFPLSFSVPTSPDLVCWREFRREGIEVYAVYDNQLVYRQGVPF
jgi:hypothetical protein